jgi:chemotaxis family two-component system sensor kinase Cph1
MEQLIEFFQRLSDVNDWPPRWFCGRWTDFHGWLYIISDLTIWLAYMAIPLILVRFLFVKKGVPLSGVFWLFGAFIMLCGLTHLLDALMFWWPAYRINALIRFLTAVVSIATVIALIRYFNEAVGLRTSKEYDRELSFRQQAMQELTRSNEELQQFAYVASHDLQSPLKTIVNYLSLLESKHADKLDGDARKLIGVSTAAADRMRILINDLLDFSRVGTELEFVEVDLNSTLAEILEEQQAEIRATGAIVKVESLPTLVAHRTDLKQVFQNLLTNGLKYHRPGVAPTVTIRAIDEGNQYLFSVNDNGIGIEPQYFDQVFQIFQRLHGRNSYSGTGIGLATCKKVVDIYGGKIWLESTVGVGSTFYVTIPKVIKTSQYYVQNHSLHSVS